MVMIEALVMSRPKERKDSPESHVVQLSSEMRMAMAMVNPSSSSLAEAAMATVMARSTPQQMEVEMAGALMATIDARELEMIMVMLKPLEAYEKQRGKWRQGDMATLDMETEMVLWQQTEI